MKNTRKFMAAVMALTMVSALSPMSAFAADTEIKPGTNGTPDPSSADFDVKYTYTIPDPTFTVTIPAGVTLSDSGSVNKSISAEDVKNMEANGKKIVVTLDSASNNATGDSTFKAKNGNSEATYTISSGETAVKVGDTVAEFTADGSSVLTFSKITLPASPVAGDYTEMLTFGIAMVNAAPAPAPASLEKLSAPAVYTYDPSPMMGEGEIMDFMDLICNGNTVYPEWSKYFDGSGKLLYPLAEDEAKTCVEYLGDKNIVVYDSFLKNGGTYYNYAMNNNGTVSTGVSPFTFFDSDRGNWSDFDGYTFYVPQS